MSYDIRRTVCYGVLIDEEAAGAAAIVKGVAAAGAELLGFWNSLDGKGGSKLSLLAACPDTFEATTKGMGLAASKHESAFLVTGDYPPDTITSLVDRLAHADVRITEMQCLAAGGDRRSALIAVEDKDADRASELLQATEERSDVVDEASQESFPASDSPAWVPAG